MINKNTYVLHCIEEAPWQAHYLKRKRLIRPVRATKQFDLRCRAYMYLYKCAASAKMKYDSLLPFP